MYYYMGEHYFIDCHNLIWLCKVIYNPFLKMEKGEYKITFSFAYNISIFFL